VRNLDAFRAVLAFDKWMGNADGRQSVFFRAMVHAPGARERKPGFVASMIDHGFAFNGPNWEFTESPVQGLYARRLVYEAVSSLDDFQPWLDLVVHFPEEVVDRAWKSVPLDWVESDADDLERVLEELLRRRSRVPEMIEACRKVKGDMFPNWR
jgi:hypothetical protein